MTTPNGGADRISTKAKLADELMVLGRVLLNTRQTQRLKQAEVAARLGLPASYLSKIENGTRRVDVVELIRIADAMGVDPADIVTRLRSEISVPQIR